MGRTRTLLLAALLAAGPLIWLWPRDTGSRPTPASEPATRTTPGHTGAPDLVGTPGKSPERPVAAGAPQPTVAAAADSAELEVELRVRLADGRVPERVTVLLEGEDPDDSKPERVWTPESPRLRLARGEQRLDVRAGRVGEWRATPKLSVDPEIAPVDVTLVALRVIVGEAGDR